MESFSLKTKQNKTQFLKPCWQANKLCNYISLEFFYSIKEHVHLRYDLLLIIELLFQGLNLFLFFFKNKETLPKIKHQLWLTQSVMNLSIQKKMSKIKLVLIFIYLIFFAPLIIIFNAEDRIQASTLAMSCTSPYSTLMIALRVTGH